MTDEFPKGMKTDLALAIAQGKSVALWARNHQVPERTAYRWANDPKVRCLVESCRRRTLDRAIGRMARRASWASDEIAKLAEGAESESVKLRALRSIVSSAAGASSKKGSGTVVRSTLRAVPATVPDPFFEYRMARIEEEHRDRTDNADISGSRFVPR